jgi:hypothetical protein
VGEATSLAMPAGLFYFPGPLGLLPMNGRKRLGEAEGDDPW